MELKYETSYKKKLKPQIIAEATSSFRQYGIRAVRMDDIARNLAISKRTLYEIYSNKEDLLIEVLRTQLQDNEKHLEQFFVKCGNVMDVLIEIFRRQIEVSAYTNNLFYKDLVRYPRAKRFLEKYYEHQDTAAEEFYDRGVKEGYFVDSVDFLTMRRILSGTMNMIQVEKKYSMLTYQDLFKNYLSVIVRGICTIEGIKRFDEFVRENFKISNLNNKT